MSGADSLEQLKHAKVDVPVNELLRRRWSPRAFSALPVSDADLKTIFTAGAWAASSYNEQPWRFVMGRNGDEAWKKIFDALLPPNQSWVKGVPVLYASFAKKTFSHNGSPNGVAVHDVGAASANMALQATSLGLHTHGMAGFDRQKLQAAFAVPADFEPVACWALGYLGDPETLPENFKGSERELRKRKSVDQFVFSAWESPAL